MFERNATFSTEAGPSQHYLAPIPVTVHASGQEGLKSALLDAFEGGIRFAPREGMSVDLAAYHNRYRRLVGYAPVAASILFNSGLPSVRAEYNIVNNSNATSTGIELSAKANLSDNVRMDLYGSWIDTNFKLKMVFDPPSIPGLPPGSTYSLPLFPQSGLVTTPHNQVGARLRWDVASGLEVDGWLRHVAALKLVDVPAYTTLDLRMAWAASQTVSVELTATNLLKRRRLEFRESLLSAAPGLVERRFAVEARVRF